MEQQVEEAIMEYRSVLAVVELDHVPSDGGPFTSVTLRDASGRHLDNLSRSGFPTPVARRLLDRYFESVSMDDHGLHVRFAVSDLQAEPLPKR